MKFEKLYAVDVATVGDKVEFNLNNDGTGVITKIYERKNYISRKAPRIKGASTRGERLEQIVAANVDNLIIVSSCQQPKFNNRTVDRFIVAAECSRINPIIVINKIDLDRDTKCAGWLELYRSIGYKVIETCVPQNIGIDELKELLGGKINLFWGVSGVGKSSLLNLLYPTLSLKTGLISEATSKGKHTTVTSLMKKVDDKTFVIDTPGIREIDPYGIRKEDVGHYFKEFSEFIGGCKFNTCTHYHEPGCAVIDAVEKKIINSERYQSYLNIIGTVEEGINF